MLRNLAQFYHKDPLDLFVVRQAQVRGEGRGRSEWVCHVHAPPPTLQGLTHLGKGTLTLNPYHSDRMLMSPVVVAGLLTVAVDLNNSIALGLEGWGGGRYWIGHVVLFLYSHSRRSQLHVILFNARHPASYACDIQCRPGASDGDCESGPGRCVGVKGGGAGCVWRDSVCGVCFFTMHVTFCLTPILEGFIILEKNPNYVEG